MPSLGDLYEEGERLDGLSREKPEWQQIALSPLEALLERLENKMGLGTGGWGWQLRAASREWNCSKEHEEQIVAAVERCESPIEKRLFVWLALERHWLFDYPTLILSAAELKNISGFSIAIVPQLKIGQYRVDFALVARLDGKPKAVVVECDGEEFHRDFEADKWRTTELLETGKVLEIVRFKGTEITRDPRECSKRVAVAVHGAWNKHRMGLQTVSEAATSGRAMGVDE